jgi:serine/threonine-protein kinase
MPLAPGEDFGGFEIVRKLGSGGMGEVYLVKHPRLPRSEALKILPAALTSDDEFRQRFNREGDVAAGLWHPHIVAVHDRGESNGQLWITMDYVEGTDAAALLRDRYPSGLPPRLAAEVVAAVADALDYAHEQGLLHRDVKPANILLSDPLGSAQKRRILLSDFGIARRMDDNSSLTATNMTVGSFAYAPPEQLTGSPLDGRTDQYALAATAFQLFTGKPPFDSSNAAIVIGNHLSSPPPLVSDRRPDLARLNPVITKAMAKEPGDRYPTCRDFAAALTHLVDAPEQVDHPTMVAGAAAHGLDSQPTQRAAGASGQPAQPSSASPPAIAGSAKPKGRKTMWIAAAAIAAVLLVVGGVLVVPRLTGSGSDESAAPSAAASPAGEPSAGEPSAGLVQPAAVDGLLLNAEQVSGIVGETLQETTTSSSVLDAANDFDRPECSGAIYPFEARMYDPSGFTAARQSLIVPAEGSPSNHIVDQSVALMPTAEAADKFRADSEREWQACAGVALAIKGSDNATTRPTLADVRTQGNSIVQDRTVAGDTAPGQRCQHVLGVWSNVVAEAVVCDDKGIGDQAQKVVDAILSNAQRS